MSSAFSVNCVVTKVEALKSTENAYDMVEEGKEMSSDDLISTGDYSDYEILEEEKDSIFGNDVVWVKTKK